MPPSASRGLCIQLPSVEHDVCHDSMTSSAAELDATSTPTSVSHMSSGSMADPPNSGKRVTFDGPAEDSTILSHSASTAVNKRVSERSGAAQAHPAERSTGNLAASTSPTTPGASQVLTIPARPQLGVSTPSSVHITSSLEESLRRAEEERQRKSVEQRQRRRKRRLGRQRQQQRSAQPKPDESGPAAQSSTSGSAIALSKASSSSATHAGSFNTSNEAYPSPSSYHRDGFRISLDDSREQSLELSEVEEESDDDDDDEEDESDDAYEDDEDYDDDGRSLTRQLAETAVSVREMSRELGRARVKSNIQSVLIVTKARDNQLIKLTREVALYLMKTPRPGKTRGMIVYVDAQLRKSKRFDAAGLERDNPDLFRSNTAHAQHHHHHHGHHSHHHHKESFSSRASRRSSSSSVSALNLLGMTSGSSVSGYSSNPTSGASTPGLASSNSLANGKPLTRLTEALVNRQLEREASRRHSQSMGNVRDGSEGTSVPGSPSVGTSNASNDEQGLLRYWTAEMCSKNPQLFDLVVTLGGDGTVLFTSWLFQHVVPPVIPFALGSLGFLTNFDYSNHQKVLDSAINDGVRVNLRMRFTATIYRAVNKDEEEERRRCVRSGETGQIFMETLRSTGWQAIESGNTPIPPSNANSYHCGGRDRELAFSITRPAESFEVLNDLVVDRGPSPYVSLLELFGDEHHMTTVQADGLCVATPTGSTAYSLSAGGSLVHPEIPTLLITPICPHTLSFRPMLLPDSMELRICVPYNSRSTAWASFDGRGRVELRQGDHIKVTASSYPFPTVCADKQSTDWFQAIQRTLKWNERQRQKSFVVVEHSRDEPHDPDDSKAKAESGYGTSSSGSATVNVARSLAANNVDSSKPSPDEEDDDGTFDIDDVSPESKSAQSPTSSQLDAQNARQSGEPAVHPPASAASVPKSADREYRDIEQQMNEPRHLRQYAIRDPQSSRNSKDRTPRAEDFKKQSNAQNTVRTRRNSAPGGSNQERVKAFVVFGVDSSDAESSASEDA